MRELTDELNLRIATLRHTVGTDHAVWVLGMIGNKCLEQPRYKGEGAYLDFTQAQYPSAGETDHQKSELLKDIFVMGNAYRTAYGLGGLDAVAYGDV